MENNLKNEYTDLIYILNETLDLYFYIYFNTLKQKYENNLTIKNDFDDEIKKSIIKNIEKFSSDYITSYLNEYILKFFTIGSFNDYCIFYIINKLKNNDI